MITKTLILDTTFLNRTIPITLMLDSMISLQIQKSLMLYISICVRTHKDTP